METIGFGNLKKTSPNGIEFQDGKRTLYFQGQAVAQGKLKGKFEPRNYFYNLRFLDDFPQIGLWAFGDAWTQRLKVGRPKMDNEDELSGVVYFGDEDSKAVYVISRAYDVYPVRAIDPGESFSTPPWVQAPLPPLFDVGLNIPLRLIVARAVLSALDDNWPYDQWQVVTSVLERGQVPEVLASDVALTYGFRLRGVPMDLRQALCEFQGLRS
jgi:hypothetical protein